MPKLSAHAAWSNYFNAQGQAMRVDSKLTASLLYESYDGTQSIVKSSRPQQTIQVYPCG